MARTADFVIIGGGIVGCSVAYHLAKRGAGKVVVLEQASLGSGSTSKAAGGIRAQFAAEVTIRMSLYSQNIYRHFKDEFGVPVDYHEIGYLFLLTTQQELDGFRRNVALQNSLGVPSRIIGPDEVKDIVPAVKVDDLSGGSFCATDGRAGPSEALHGFVRRGRELGVEFFEDSPVQAIDLDGGRRVRAVRTAKEIFETSVVVNAAGPWASQVGKLVGAEIPVRPLKRHIWITERFDEMSGPTPQVIDFHTGFYFRKELDSVMWSGGDMLERWSFDTETEWDRLQESVEKAARRVPILANARMMRGWAGLREVTPDHLPIIGQVPEAKGFVCATGFSGHGFMHAPASGRLVAELLLDARTFLDISPFRPERFSEPGGANHRELSIGARLEDE
jgi:sarcosine oxidase subunit beta